MNARIERLRTIGNVDPDGPPVHENNVFIIGDDKEVIVVDPAHSPKQVVAAVGDRTVLAILLTHGHWDHCRATPEFAELVDAPVYLGDADQFLWAEATGQAGGYSALYDGAEFEVGGVTVRAVATPGHTPGSTSLRVDALGAVLSGDTLFPGGPGATRWDYSDFETIIHSLRRLFQYDDATTVHPGHGDDTTIGDEKPHLDEWIERGW